MVSINDVLYTCGASHVTFFLGGVGIVVTLFIYQPA